MLDIKNRNRDLVGTINYNWIHWSKKKCQQWTISEHIMLPIGSLF